MAKYRKRPVEVEAEQWFEGSNFEEWPACVRWNEGGYYYLETAGGPARLHDGDWVITEPDDRGHYPCRPDIFAATYEAVPGVVSAGG